MSHLSIYIAIFLDQDSKGLLRKLQSFVPDGWKWYGSHMNIKFFGKAMHPEDFPEPYNELAAEGKSISLTVSHIGISDNAIAVKVEGYPLEHQVAHITLATPEGGAPKNSKDITNWKKIKPFTLHGTIMGNGDAGEIIHEQKILAWHGGNVIGDFNSKRGDFGIHFGTKEQAASRLKTKKDGNIQKYEIELKHPINLYFDMGWWDDLEKWKELGYIPTDYYGDIITKLKHDGWDGIIYPNSVEGEGDSYIVFNTSSIKPIKKDSNSEVVEETDEVSDTIIPMSGRWNDQMDGGDYDMQAWAAPTMHVKYGGNMSESVIKKLVAERLQQVNELGYGDVKNTIGRMSNIWITPDGNAMKVKDHFDTLPEKYKRIKNSKEKYYAAFKDGYVRVIYAIIKNGSTEKPSLSIEGTDRNRIKEVVRAYLPAMNAYPSYIFIDNPDATHYSFDLPEDRYALYDFFETGNYKRKFMDEGNKKGKVEEPFMQDLSVLKREHVGWITPDDKFIGGESHMDYLYHKYSERMVALRNTQGNMYDSSLIYNEAYNDGLVRVYYITFTSMQNVTAEVGLTGNNLSRIKELLEKYYYSFFSDKKVNMVVSIQQQYYEFNLPKQKAEFANFVFGTTTESIIKKLVLKEITSTFPMNVGGAAATYDSWTDSTGDANKQRLDGGNLGLNEIEYTNIHKMPFIDAIEQAGGKVYQVVNSNEIVVKYINLLSLIKIIAPFGISKMKKNNNLIAYRPNNYSNLIYLWVT